MDDERIAICGMGWVTPLGNELADVAARVRAGEIAPEAELANPATGKIYRGRPVPKNATVALHREPRLRRSSVISLFSTTAALAALADAGLTVTPESAERIAIIFAVANGGVVYTRKFYDGIVKGGAGAGSPLLFPETVYNAPASHLAAMLGVTGITYTLVGDASVGLAAVKYAEQLLRADEADYCLVAGAEELDWVLCQAYADWRLPVRLAEGGAALVLGRAGGLRLDFVHDGVSFARRAEAGAALREVLHAAPSADLAVVSANGTFIDEIERAALAETHPGLATLAPKAALGDAIGASALWQMICGALAVRDGAAERALISCLGLNQQASAAVISCFETR